MATVAEPPKPTATPLAAPAPVPAPTLTQPALEVPSWEADLASTIEALPEGAPAEPRTRGGKPPEPAPTPPKTTPPPSAPAPGAQKPAADPKAAKPGDAKPVEPAKPSEPPKPGEATPAPTDPAADPAPGAPDPAAKFHTAHDLRRELRRLHRVADGYKKEVEQLKSAPPAKPAAPDPEVATLRESAAAMRKRLDEAESELRHANYLRSSEYREKFEGPFTKALNDAYATVKEFTIEGPDGAVREATTQDFDRILNLPLGAAIKEAKALFGDAADEIMSYRRKLVEIKRNATEEVERNRSEGKAREEQKVAQEAERREALQRGWKAANEKLVEQYPEVFAPEAPEVEGSEEGNERLRQGYAAVDKANDASLPLEERIARQAAVRHRAAAFGREVLRRRRLEARVKELEQALKEYEESTPQRGSKDGTSDAAPAADENDPFKQIDEMAREQA